MRVLATIAQMHAERARLHGTLGFAPTMGALHAGHLALVDAAKQACDAVAASIFVNPTQFNEAADFQRYPRMVEADLAMLERAGCDFVFAPAPDELYPRGFATRIDVGPVAAPLEGAMRAGHFNGVAIVVTKLFNIVRPTRAFFGRKDAQQVAVIRRLVRDLDMPIEIVAIDTVREADGLAMSSRNALLSAEDRAAAAVLHRALDAARALYDAGERDGDVLRAQMRQILASEPRGAVEYASIADPESLMELAAVDGRGALASLAVRFGAVRLIDNVTLPAKAG